MNRFEVLLKCINTHPSRTNEESLSIVKNLDTDEISVHIEEGKRLFEMDDISSSFLLTMIKARQSGLKRKFSLQEGSVDYKVDVYNDNRVDPCESGITVAVTWLIEPDQFFVSVFLNEAYIDLINLIELPEATE